VATRRETARVVDDVGDMPCWAERVCDACGALLEDASHLCPQVNRPLPLPLPPTLPPLPLPLPLPLPRSIVGFHQDEAGDWVAELSCLHSQHVRHRPPFQVRPWVERAEGRAGRLGTEIDCPLCARAELPGGLTVTRTAGPFDAASLPAGLLKEHMVAEGRWGCLHVIEGNVTFSLNTKPSTIVRLGAGDRQAIPPGVPHALTLDGPVRLTIDFLTAG
jgi:tellurite methyltransferase